MSAPGVTPVLDRISEALPERFAFYHLGEIQKQEQEFDVSAIVDSEAVAFSLAGDVQGALLLIFDRGLDSSMYSEVGNTIASKLSTTLMNSESSLELLISPPKPLTTSQLERLLRAQKPALSRKYLHVTTTAAIELQVVLLIASQTRPGGIYA